MYHTRPRSARIRVRSTSTAGTLAEGGFLYRVGRRPRKLDGKVADRPSRPSADRLPAERATQPGLLLTTSRRVIRDLTKCA